MDKFSITYSRGLYSQTLDSYCELNNISQIDFIEIDVEGAEKYIFDGATKLLENKKNKMWGF